MRTKLVLLSFLFGLFYIYAVIPTAKLNKVVLTVSFETNPASVNGIVEICQGTSVTFTSTSQDVPEGATYLWSFNGGDSTSANTQGPHTILFSTTGTYPITLDIDGTSATLTVNVINGPNIEPVIESNGWGTSTFDGSTYFTWCNSASGQPGYETNFSFQTASTNTSQNSIHTFSTGNGSIITSFTGENYNSINSYIDHFVQSGYSEIVYTIQEGTCIFQKTYNLYVGASPTATISNSGVPVLCSPGVVQYGITPGAQNGPGTIYKVEVSDGSDPVFFNHPPPAIYEHNFNSVSCGADPIEFNDVVYTNAFEISITTSNACGQSTNGYAPIYIESGPEAAYVFNPDPPSNTVCLGTSISALDSTIPGSNITNGVCDNLYKRFWQIKAPNGSILTSTNAGILNSNPYITVSGHLGYVPGGISLLADSASSWSSNAATEINMTFLQSGNYEVTLFTGSSGQSNRCGITEYTETICVTPEVIADFDLSSYLICGPASISTTNNSSITGCSNQNTYEWTVSFDNPQGCPVSNSPNWEFSNGTDANSIEPEFQFNTPGVYTVTLTTNLNVVTNGSMCEPDSISKDIIIKEKPQTTLPDIELCENESFTFNLQLFNCYAEQNTTVLWDFGGVTELSIDDNTILNPSISFTTEGVYPYTLTLTNECGVTTLNGSVEIFPEVILNVNGPPLSCVNADIQLSGSISGGASTGTWSASITGGQFLPSSTDLMPLYTPPIDFTGIVTFTLTSEDPIGPCPEVSDSVDIEIQPEATADAGLYEPFCINTNILLNGTIGGAATSGTWTANVPGSFSDQNDLNATFTPEPDFTGNITFTLTTNDPIGPCESVFDESIVAVIPLGQVNPIPNNIYCDADLTNLIAFTSTELGTTFEWANDTPSIGLAATGTGDINPFNIVNIGIFPLVANITVTPIISSSSTSCPGQTQSFTITVNPAAQVDTPTNLVLCDGDTQPEILLNTQNTVGTTTYSWVNDTPGIGLSASGSGSITAFTAENTGSTPITASITVTPSYENAGVTCSGPVQSFTITVNPAAQVDTPTNLVLCDGDTQPEILLNTQNTVGTTTYSWVNDTPGIGLSASGSGSITAFTAENTGSTPITAGITVTPSYENAGVTCSGPVQSFTITVNPAAQVDTPTNLVLCDGDTQPEILLNTQNTVGTTTYSWVNDTPGIGLSASGSGSITAFTAENTGSTPITAGITVTPSYENAGVTCSGPVQSFTITVNPAAQVDTPTNLVLCDGDTQPEILLNTQNTVGTTTYSWVNDTPGIGLSASGSGSITAFTAENTGSTPITASITVTPSYENAGVTCSGPVQSFTITVNPIPTMNSVTPQTICGDTAFSTPSYVADISGVSYIWELTSTNIPSYILGYPMPSGSGQLNGTVIQNNGTDPFTLAYDLTVSFNGCFGNTVPFTLTVDPSPSVNFDLPNQGVCDGQFSNQVTLTSNTANVDINWSIDPSLYPDISGITQTSGTTTIPSFTLLNTSNPATSVDLVFTAQAQTNSTAACYGVPTEYIITVNPTAQVNKPPDQIICDGTTTTDINFTTTNIGNIGGTQTGINGSDEVFLIFNNGYLGTAGSNTNKSVSILTFETLGILNVSFTQSDFDGDGLFSVQGNDISGNITFNFLDGSSVTFNSTINFRLNSQNNILEIIGFVFDPAVNYSFNYGNNQSYVITGGTLSNISTYLGLAAFNNSIVFNDGDTITGNAASAQTLDDLNDYLVSVIGFSGTTSYIWTNDTTSIGLAASGSESITSFNAVNDTNDPVVATITVTPFFQNANSSCPGPSEEFTITVNPSPKIINSELSQTICSGSASDAVIWESSISNGELTTYVWNFVSITAGLSGHETGSGIGTLPSMTISNTGLDVGEVVYEIIPTAYGCTGEIINYTINVNPVVEIANIQSQTLCSGSNSLEVIWALTNPTLETATVFDWSLQTTTVPPGTTGLVNNGQGNLPSMEVNITSTTTASVEYLVTPIVNGCSGTPFTHTLVIDPIPVMNAIAAQTICSETSFELPILDSDVVGTTYTWELLNIASVPLDLSGYPTDNTTTFPANVITNIGTDAFTFNYEFTPVFNGCIGNAVLFPITVNPAPVVSITPPEAQSLCLNGSFEPLSVSYQYADIVSDVTYQWYSNTSDSTVLSSATLITGATSNTHTPLSNTIGTLYYFCVVSFNPSICNDEVSSTVAITVENPPSISSNPQPSQTICIGGTVLENSISVSYNGGSGTPDYQWFVNTTATLGGTLIPGSNSPTIDPGIFDTSGTYYYWVSISFPNGDGCGGVFSDFAEVIVLDDPTIDALLSTQSICQNTSPTDLVAIVSGGTGTYSYQWYESPLDIAIPGATSPMFSPPTDVVGVFNYYVIVTTEVSGCENSSTLSEVTVNEGASISIQPIANQTVCLDGTTIDLSVAHNNGVGAPTYQWYSNIACDNTDLSNPIAGATSSSYTPPSDVVGSNNYFVVLNFAQGGCVSIASDCALVNVSPDPEITITSSAPSPICEGGQISDITITTTGVGTPTYSWWSSDALGNVQNIHINSTNSASFNPGLFTTTGTFYYVAMVSYDGSGCDTTNSDVVTVEVVADPVLISPILTQTVCKDTPSAALIGGASGATGVFSYEWFENSNPTTVLSTASTFTPPSNLVGTFHYYYVVTTEASGCENTSTQSEVIVNEGASITTQPVVEQTVCLDEPTTVLSVGYNNGVGVPTYQWYSNTTCDNTDLSNPIAGATTSSYTPPSDVVGSITYFVVLNFSQGGCLSIASDCALVNVGDIPVIRDVSETVCSLDAFLVSPVQGGGSNFDDIIPSPTLYTWTTTGNPNLLGWFDTTNQAEISQTLQNITNIPQQIDYTVTPISQAIGNCVGDTFLVSVTVNPKPTISNKTHVVCSSETINWTLPNSDGTGGSDIIPANTTYTWTTTGNSNVTGYSSNASGSTTLSQVLINESDIPQDVTYTITPTSNLGCPGTPFTLIITVNPLPTITNKTTEICSGDAFLIDPESNLPTEIVPTNTLYTWEVLSPPSSADLSGWSDVSLGEPTISQTLINNLNSIQTVTYLVTPISGICQGDTFEVEVIILPSPDVLISTPLQTKCSGDPFDAVAFTSSVTGTTFDYVLQNTTVPTEIEGYLSNITGTGDFPSLVLTNGLTDPYTLIYTVTPSLESIGGNLNCAGIGENFELTINPSPQILFSQLDQEICNNESSLPITLVSSSPNVTIEWTRNNPVGLIGFVAGDELGTTQIPSYTLENITNSPIDIIYTAKAITQGTAVCDGPEFSYIITVNPTAKIDGISNQTICSGSSFVDVVITSPTTPTGAFTYSWEVLNAGASLSGFTVNSGALPLSIATPISGETVINTSPSAEDLIYSLTPYFNSCPGETQTFTITVDPTPEIFTMNTTICSEETFTVLPQNGNPTAATIIPVNTTYTWSVLANSNVSGQANETLAQTNISQTLVNNTNTSQDVVYSVTPLSEDGCEGSPFELTVTVEPRPIISNKFTGICSGDTFFVDPTDNSPLEIVPDNTLYTWTVLAGADLAYLTGYSDQTTAISAISQTLFNLSDETRTIMYQVTPTLGVCQGVPFELEVTISPRPFVDDIVLTPICSEDTFIVSPQTGFPTVNTSVPAGTTFTWTVVDNLNVVGESNELVPQNQISQTLTNITSVTQTVVYNVTPSSAGCDGLPFSITIDVKPRPFIVSSPDLQDTQCSGNSFVILPQDGIPNSVTLVPVGTQYTWVVSVPNPNLTGWSNLNTPTSVITQNLINTTNQIQQITYTITPESNGCVGPSFDAVITIEPKPFIPNLIVDICDASSYVLSPQNGIEPNSNTIIPDITRYTWSAPIVTGGITGGSVGNDESFFDSGILENPTTAFQTAVFTITPNYYTISNPTTPQCSGDPFTITITVSPSPEINEVITNILCSYSDPLCGASIEISPVGIGPFTYNWVSLEGNPISNSADANQFNLCPGNYRLNITDASNCSYEYNYEIIPPEPITFNLITLTDISCNNVNTVPCDGSIAVTTTGGTLPYSLVEWYSETIPNSGIFDSGPFTNTANPFEINNACEGNYVLKILDANGCEFISDIYVIEPAVNPIVFTETVSNYNGFNIDCNAANNGFISINLSGGSGQFTYSFIGGGTPQSGTILTSPATLSFDFLTAGLYELTVTDPNCPEQIVRSYTLTQPQELIATATLVNPAECFGGLATYNVTATGGLPPYLGTGLIQVPAGPTTFTVSDANSCIDDFSTVVNQPAQISTPFTVSDALCYGEPGIITVTPSGGTGVLTVNLYDENSILIEDYNTTQGITVSFNKLVGTYYFDVVDANNCTSPLQIVVINEPAPIVIQNIVVTQPDCNTTPSWEFNNGSICITITGGTNPFPTGSGWVNNGGGLWCLDGLSEGVYAITVTDVNGCLPLSPTADITLTRPPEITVSFFDTFSIDCSTYTATQTNVVYINGGVPPYDITWSGGYVNPTSPNIMDATESGNYSVFVNDQYGIANGCPPIEFPLDPINFFEFGVSDFTVSSANFNFCGVYAVSDPVTFSNNSTGDIVDIIWDFGDGSPQVIGDDNPSYVYESIGTYTVSLTVNDVYGCSNTYLETIEITKGYEIILPNAFTPNADGINETMRPVFTCMTEIQMSIYDTWGSLIYSESSDGNLYGWDGTIKGNPAENGNYIMVVHGVTFNGTVVDLNGPVTLIK